MSNNVAMATKNSIPLYGEIKSFTADGKTREYVHLYVIVEAYGKKISVKIPFADGTALEKSLIMNALGLSLGDEPNF